jgi:hypothetical protein
MSAIKRFFLSLRIFLRTFAPPEKITPIKRNETRGLITELSRRYGFEPNFSARQKFVRTNIELVKSRVRGVYRLYSGDDLVYIGASCDEIRGRLLDQFRETYERPNRKPNKIAQQLHNTEASFDWLFTAFPGWVEELYLLEHELETGSLPRANTNKRSNLLWKCPY